MISSTPEFQYKLLFDKRIMLISGLDGIFGALDTFFGALQKNTNSGVPFSDSPILTREKGALSKIISFSRIQIPDLSFKYLNLNNKTQISEGPLSLTMMALSCILPN